jgi:hypothetical protein
MNQLPSMDAAGIHTPVVSDSSCNKRAGRAASLDVRTRKR